MKEIHGLFSTWGYDDVIAWDAAQGHVLSMALTLMWGSVLMSMTPLTSEGLAASYMLSGPPPVNMQLSMDMPQQGVGVFSKPVLPSRTITTAGQDLLLWDISESMTLLQQVSVLKSQLPVAIKSRTNACNLD